MRALLFVAMVAAVLLAGMTPAAADNRIIDIRTGGTSELARLVVESSEDMPFSLHLLSEPYRLVIDMPESLWSAGGRPREAALQTSPLSGYRFGNPAPGLSRLVIDLDGPAIPVKAFRLPPNDGAHRLVIDLSESGPTSFQLAARALKQHGGQLPELDEAPETSSIEAVIENLAILMPEPRPTRTVGSRGASGQLLPLPRPDPPTGAIPGRKWVVFIDPGHGGKDPGAIGVSGTREKDINLKAARELARQLESTGRIRALLSRDDDRFHRLRTRIDLARKAKADVFISLHADAAPNRKAKGVSIFTLSDRASDKEAALIAAPLRWFCRAEIAGCAVGADRNGIPDQQGG